MGLKLNCEYVFIEKGKQRRKDEAFYIGGRREFGFNVVDGIKITNLEEQKLLKKMKKMRDKGKTLKEIHKWLNVTKGIKLAYSSMRIKIINSNS